MKNRFWPLLYFVSHFQLIVFIIIISSFAVPSIVTHSTKLFPFFQRILISHSADRVVFLAVVIALKATFKLFSEAREQTKASPNIILITHSPTFFFPLLRGIKFFREDEEIVSKSAYIIQQMFSERIIIIFIIILSHYNIFVFVLAFLFDFFLFLFNWLKHQHL